MKLLTSIAAGVLSMICAPILSANPLEGSWYNAYCSRIDLSVGDQGLIQGGYTSHTGSTGSSLAIGLVNPGASATANKGIPFSLGIQWRLVNVDQSKADGSWHWVSMFSGQYHPAQTIAQPDQDPYSIPETLEVLNLLIATATVPGLANTAPLAWPQSLDFHRSPPNYCHAVEPGAPVAYKPTAADNVTGTWKGPNGEILLLRFEEGTKALNGLFDNNTGETFSVIGYFDTLAAPSSGDYSVAWQGLTLSLLESSPQANAQVKSLAGGVDYADTSKMYLWASDLGSTTWTDRFTQQTLDMATYTKQ